MFSDLVGSSHLAERLDPEDLRQVVATYHAVSSRAIQRFGGYVAQYLGDGILAYFSYPEAHEDDPERAVLAGLEIVSDVESVNRRLETEYGVRASIRVGIHTGPVVVGEFGSGPARENLALGGTVNIASRLEGLAEPDSVLISDATYRLVRGRFVTESLGSHSLHGMAEPVGLRRVLRPSGEQSQPLALPQTDVCPLVGRKRELATLVECWREAREGHGRAVLVSGDPGVGKSRLLHALWERLAGEEPTWLECRGSPHYENSALYPIIALLRQGLGLRPEPPPEEQLEGLERGLAGAGLPVEALPLLGRLLSLPLPEERGAEELAPEEWRRRTLEVLETWLFALARQHPTVLAFEDLHWADPSTLELLGSVIGRAASAALLIVASFRAPFEPPWELGAEVRCVRLEPFTRSEARAMVDALAGRGTLPSRVHRQVVRKTDGVPLFIEELTKSLLEAGVAAEEGGEASATTASELEIPSTLQDSLAARLDRLGPAKEIAQVAALLGREFPWELLEAVSEADPGTLGRALAELVSAGVIHPSREGSDRSYVFKHALVQEWAYQSLLRSRRRALHERTARVLEERFPELVASGPEAVARHYERGGCIEEAIVYRERAGERAMEAAANAEAIAQLGRAIELLLTRPEGPERDRREFALQLSLGAQLVAASGWGSRDAERAYVRARELSERVGETLQEFRVFRGLVTFYIARAELDTAHGLCRRLLRLAERGGLSERLVAHNHMGYLLFYEGDPAGALRHHERALAFYEPSERHSFLLRYGEAPRTFVYNPMAWAAWLCGYPDRAVAISRDAVRCAREAAHPFSVAFALLWAAVVHVMRREPGPAGPLAEEAAALAEAEGFAFVHGGGRLVRAWAKLYPSREEGEKDRAVEEFREALAAVGTTGVQITTPMILGDLADASTRLGRHEEALAAAESALAVARKTGQPFWNADLLRTQGEALLASRNDAENRAERLFREALEVARRQGARSLELRAAVSLATLYHRRGRRDQARALLSPIYESFDEGFDSPDLVAARGLRDALA